MGMGMGIDQWEWQGIEILIVFPHTSTLQSQNKTLNYCYRSMCSSRAAAAWTV